MKIRVFTEGMKRGADADDGLPSLKKLCVFQEKAQMDTLVEELQQQLTRLPLQQRARWCPEIFMFLYTLLIRNAFV